MTTHPPTCARCGDPSAILRPGDIVRTPDGLTALVVGVGLVALMVKADDGNYADIQPSNDLTLVPHDEPGDQEEGKA